MVNIFHLLHEPRWIYWRRCTVEKEFPPCSMQDATAIQDHVIFLIFKWWCVVGAWSSCGRSKGNPQLRSDDANKVSALCHHHDCWMWEFIASAFSFDWNYGDPSIETFSVGSLKQFSGLLRLFISASWTCEPEENFTFFLQSAKKSFHRFSRRVMICSFVNFLTG